MKKILFLLTLVGMFTGFASCTKSQTELSGSTLSTKVVVSGHVRYIPKNQSGTDQTPQVVNSGVPVSVNVFYGVPGEGGKVTYAIKTLKADNKGFFQTKIGCPAGQALDVKVQALYQGSSFASQGVGKTYVSTDAYFFAEVQKSIPCGSAAYFQLDMQAVSYTSHPGLTQ